MKGPDQQHWKMIWLLYNLGQTNNTCNDDVTNLCPYEWLSALQNQ